MLRSVEINEDGPHFVHIEARKAGVFSWVNTILGVDATTTLDVYEDCIEHSAGSLYGTFTETIPLTSVSNFGAGFLKPFSCMILSLSLLALAAFAVFSADGGVAEGVVLLTLSVVFAFLYWTRKTLALYFTTSGGSTTFVAFKRSLIERVALDAPTAKRIIRIVSSLVMKNTAH